MHDKLASAARPSVETAGFGAGTWFASRAGVDPLAPPRSLRRVAEAFVVTAMLAIALEQQARGIAALLMGELAARSLPIPRPAPALEPPPPRDRSADVLLSRNPFDSSFAEREARRAAGPLAVERCPELSAAVVTVSSDPEFSLATLAEAHGVTRLVRIGDVLARRRVAFIGQNPVEASPAVWLSDGAELCQVVLRDRGRAQPTRIETPPAEPPASGTMVLVQAGIVQRGPTERDVQRGLIELVAEHREELLAHVRFLRPRGAKHGVQVVGVRPGSLLELLGLKNGDVILDVNGLDLSTPAGSLGALGALRSASDLELDVERAGRPLRLGFHLH